MIRTGFLWKSVSLAALAGAVAFAGPSCSDDQGFTGSNGGGGGGASGGSTQSGGTGGTGGGEPGCSSDSDCDAGEVCEQGHCLPAACVDGELNGSESDVDCGGSDCLPCVDGKVCTEAGDCASGFCDLVAAGQGGAGGAGGAGGTPQPTEGICGPCTSHDDCAASDGTYCLGGACVPQKDAGASCDDHRECASGFCPGEDGVCCNANCTGACEACSADKTGEDDGLCAPVLADSDPDGECPDEGAASCGSEGTGCNGDAVAPGCNLYGASTECAAASCADGDAIPAQSCDGEGSCAAESPQPCAPYACAAGACLDSCTDDGDCDDAHYCSGASCVAKKNPGDGCSAANECLSGFCPGDDGICCDAVCDGTCEACLGSKTGGANGVCGFVTDNTDPDAECPTLQSCNGSGACSL